MLSPDEKDAVALAMVEAPFYNDDVVHAWLKLYIYFSMCCQLPGGVDGASTNDTIIVLHSSNNARECIQFSDQPSSSILHFSYSVVDGGYIIWNAPKMGRSLLIVANVESNFSTKSQPPAEINEFEGQYFYDKIFVRGVDVSFDNCLLNCSKFGIFEIVLSEYSIVRI